MSRPTYAGPMSRGSVACSIFVVAVSLGGCSQAPGPWESYRPPVASIVRHVDCTAPDIIGPLFGGDRWNADNDPSAVKPGYPLGHFMATAVVRCERGETPEGSAVVDSVRFEGNVGAVVEAFREESRRPRENVIADCLFAERPPAGMWLVDKFDRAIRLAWPADICGYKDDPLAPLASLREVSRQRAELPAMPTGALCDAGRHVGLGVTTQADVDRIAESVSTGEMDSPADKSATPIGDVGGLTVCTYVTSDDQVTTGSSVRLPLRESRDVVRAALAAPLAKPCDTVPQRVATAALLRADGSGGAPLVAELDGCRRVDVGFGPTRAPDSAVVDVLDHRK